MRAFRALLGKELRLQRGNALFLVATLLVAGGMSVLCFWRTAVISGTFTLGDFLTVLFMFAIVPMLTLLLPLMFGATAVAAERKMEVIGWHLAMPVGAWRQWLVKALVVTGLSLLSGWGAVELAEWAFPGVKWSEQIFRAAWPGMTSVLMGLVGLYASSVSRDSYPALFVGCVVVAAVVAPALMLDPPGVTFPLLIDYPSRVGNLWPTFVWYGLLGILMSLLAVSNMRLTLPRWPRVAIHLMLIAAVSGLSVAYALKSEMNLMTEFLRSDSHAKPRIIGGHLMAAPEPPLLQSKRLALEQVWVLNQLGRVRQMMSAKNRWEIEERLVQVGDGKYVGVIHEDIQHPLSLNVGSRQYQRRFFRLDVEKGNLQEFPPVRIAQDLGWMGTRFEVDKGGEVVQLEGAEQAVSHKFPWYRRAVDVARNTKADAQSLVDRFMAPRLRSKHSSSTLSRHGGFAVRDMADRWIRTPPAMDRLTYYLFDDKSSEPRHTWVVSTTATVHTPYAIARAQIADVRRGEEFEATEELGGASGFLEPSPDGRFLPVCRIIDTSMTLGGVELPVPYRSHAELLLLDGMTGREVFLGRVAHPKNWSYTDYQGMVDAEPARTYYSNMVEIAWSPDGSLLMVGVGSDIYLMEISAETVGPRVVGRIERLTRRAEGFGHDLRRFGFASNEKLVVWDSEVVQLYRVASKYDDGVH